MNVVPTAAMLGGLVSVNRLTAKSLCTVGRATKGGRCSGQSAQILADTNTKGEAVIVNVVLAGHSRIIGVRPAGITDLREPVQPVPGIAGDVGGRINSLHLVTLQDGSGTTGTVRVVGVAGCASGSSGTGFWVKLAQHPT